MAKKNANGIEDPLEKQLWVTADKHRKNIDTAEYKHIVLGLKNLFKKEYGFKKFISAK